MVRWRDPLQAGPRKPVSSSSRSQIAVDGLWRNNQGLVALLGLCPLLAVSNTVVNALGLGLATTLVLCASSGIVSLIRHHITREVRLPVFVLVIAASVTVIELLMNAYFHALYQTLGIFIPLIVTNCAIIGRAEAFASKNTVDRAVWDGFCMGVGFTAVLLVLGAVREAVGSGAVLSHAELMFGPAARSWKLTLSEDYQGCLLAALPPGAFITLGLLVAAKNAIDARAARVEPLPEARSER